MDVRLPDGTMLRNVPDGTTREQIAQKLGRPDLLQSAPAAPPTAALPPIPDPYTGQPQVSQPAAPKPPSHMDYLRASPGGQLLEGMTDPIRGAMQFAPHAAEAVTSLGGYAPNPVSRAIGGVAQSMDTAVAGNEQRNQEARGKFEGSDSANLWRTGGNVVSPANMVPGRLVAPAASTVGRIGQGMGLGAVGGASAPVTDTQRKPYWQTKRDQVALGTAAGVASSGILEAGARTINPTVRHEARALLDEGIPLTPGQIRGGITRRVEDAATSIPITGDAIRGAQTRSIEGMNRAALNRALAPIGGNLPDNVPLGREAVDYVATQLGDSYDNLLPRLQGRADPQFVTDVQTLLQRAANELPPQQAARFQQTVQNQIVGKAAGGLYDGNTLKGIESVLGSQARGYSGSQDWDVRQLGDLLDDLQGTVRDMLARNNPALAPELQAINHGWANYAIVRRAASSTASVGGVFNPNQLSTAVRASDRSAGKGAFARGTATMQDLSDAAKTVLPSTVPDSGTPLRTIVGLGSLGLGGSVNPLIPALQLGAAGMYTRPGQAMMEGALAHRPANAQALADALRRWSPSVAAPSGSAIAQILQQQGPK